MPYAQRSTITLFDNGFSIVPVKVCISGGRWSEVRKLIEQADCGDELAQGVDRCISVSICPSRALTDDLVGMRVLITYGILGCEVRPHGTG